VKALRQATFTDPSFGVAYCKICGRLLRAPESISQGMGPLCAFRERIQLKLFHEPETTMEES
jgi:hypothetical protein